MRSTAGWLLAAVALMPGAGCLWLDHQPTEISPTNVGRDSNDKPAETELPPAKTAEIMLALATKLETKGTPDQALRAYEQARSLDPSCTDRTAHHVALLYDKTDQLSKAMPEYERALKLAPKNANLLNDFGYHWYCVGNWNEAEKYFRQALAVDAHHDRARMNLGLALAQQRRDDEALEVFRKVVAPADALSNLGFILLARGQKDDARAAYRKALLLDPNSRVARAALNRLDNQPAPTSDEVVAPLGGSVELPAGPES
jgi:Tfp pilus assembly protein PilF